MRSRGGFILVHQVLASAAQELSKPVAEKSDLPSCSAAGTDLTPYPGDNPVHWRQVVEKRIQSKTKRLSKVRELYTSSSAFSGSESRFAPELLDLLWFQGATQPQVKATPNRYAPVAGHFFFPLLRNYDKWECLFCSVCFRPSSR